VVDVFYGDDGRQEDFDEGRLEELETKPIETTSANRRSSPPV
jgi:hypothetical protein